MPDFVPEDARPPARAAVVDDHDCPRCGYPGRYYDASTETYSCAGVSAGQPDPCGYVSSVVYQ